MELARAVVLSAAVMSVSLCASAQTVVKAEPPTSGASIEELNRFYCGASQEPKSVIEIAKLITGVTAIAATTPSGAEGVVWFVRSPSSGETDHQGVFSFGSTSSKPGPGVFVASAKGYCHVGFWRQEDQRQVLAGHYPAI